MDRETLSRLEKLNQLSLDESQRDEILAFFSDRYEEVGALSEIDTENVERMVHVMPMSNVMRGDTASKPFTREQLQKGAPETSDGYWQVPRLVE